MLGSYAPSELFVAVAAPDAGRQSFVSFDTATGAMNTSGRSNASAANQLADAAIQEFYANRPWRQGDNPKTAVREYLKRLQETPRFAADGERLAFQVDKTVEDKVLMTVAPDGYLKRVPHR